MHNPSFPTFTHHPNPIKRKKMKKSLKLEGIERKLQLADMHLSSANSFCKMGSFTVNFYICYLYVFYQLGNCAWNDAKYSFTELNFLFVLSTHCCYWNVISVIQRSLTWFLLSSTNRKNEWLLKIWIKHFDSCNFLTCTVFQLLIKRRFHRIQDHNIRPCVIQLTLMSH